MMNAKRKRKWGWMALAVVLLCGGAWAESALDFDGVNDYVDCGNGASLNITDAISISLWIYPNSSDVGFLVDKWWDGSNRAYYISRTSNGDIKFGMSRADGYAEIEQVVGAYTPVDQWSHIVLTSEGPGGQIYAYVNGTAYGPWAKTETIATNNAPVSFGVFNHAVIGKYQYFDGIIDDVAIYDRALTSQEVQDLYNGGPVIIDANLKGYWAMNEGSGQVAADSSGNGNDGQLGSTSGTDSSDPAWLNFENYALDFDGVDDYVRCGNGASLNITDAISISLWIYPNSSDVGFLVDKWWDGSNRAYYISRTSNGDIKFGMSRADGYAEIEQVVGAYTPVDQWSHIVLTSEGPGGQIYAYVNGTAYGPWAKTETIATNNAPVSFGVFNHAVIGKYQYFDGIIDDVAIYDRALTSQEVQDLYNGGPVIIDANLKGYWAMNEGSGQVAADSSGNGNDGQLGSTSGVDNADPNWILVEDDEPQVAIYHVDDANGSDGNDGQSKETAFKTIQHAIDMALDGSTILVWPGVYHESTTQGINFKGKAVTVKSAADAAVLQVPDYTAVSFVQGEGINSVLSNMVIRGSDTGIFAQFSLPTIDHVTVVDNNNGAIADNADPCITNSIFWGNTNGDLYNCTAEYSYIESELDANLIAYWKLDGDAVDSAGTNDGMIYGAVTVTGQVNNALGFNGSSDYVDCGNDSSLDVSTEFTVCAWIQLDDTSNNHIIAARDNLTTGRAWALHYHENYNSLVFYVLKSDSSYTQLQNGTFSFVTGIWYHVAATYEYVTDGTSKMRIYVNGQLDNTADTAVGPIQTGTSTNVHIGKRDVSSTPFYFDGLIDEVRIFDTVLTEQEISAMYEAGLAGQEYQVDPQFADGPGGDYHLKSERGRYRATTDEWLLDDITSPCVDGGDPTINPENERMPNGGRVNMGAYGNTAYASMSEWALKGDLNYDGSVDFKDFAWITQGWLEKEEWK